VPKLSVDVEGIISGAHGSFEEQNKVLESSKIVSITLLLIIMLMIIIV
jgi:hypothetical protein